MRRHLETCPDCAAEVAFAGQFVESALAQGGTHLRPERILGIADDPNLASSVEHRHLESCEACRSEIEWARGTRAVSALGDADAPVLSATRRPRRHRRIWISAAAVAAAAAVVVLVWAPLNRGPVPYASLIVAESLPVRITRSTDSSDPAGAARLRGLEAYAAGNYPAAGDRFGEALALRPGDPELLLYAGSARLLAGDAGGAAPLLEQGLEHADAAELRAELSWQLADARLELGDVEAARKLLTAIAGQGDGHASDARRVLRRLR